jgi:hypothetical protein
MEWDYPICIPTRGGASPQVTYRNLPDELKKFVIFYSSEKIQEDIPEAVEKIVSVSGIAEKRQLILDDMSGDFVMVDDDVRLYKNTSKTIIAEYSDFIEFKKEFLLNEDFALFSTHGRAFSNYAKRISPGLAKFVLHRRTLIQNERYDQVTHFEDIDFCLQLLKSGKKLAKFSGLVDVNKISMYEETAEDFNIIFDRWAAGFQEVMTYKPKPSNFIGKVEIPHSYKIEWSKPFKESSNTLGDFFE